MIPLIQYYKESDQEGRFLYVLSCLEELYFFTGKVAQYKIREATCT